MLLLPDANTTARVQFVKITGLLGHTRLVCSLHNTDPPLPTHCAFGTILDFPWHTSHRALWQCHENRRYIHCASSFPAGARRCRCHRSLCTCSSRAGARRGHCHRSLCTCSFRTGARRCGCRHIVYICASPVDSCRCWCRQIRSSVAGACRGCCPHIDYTGSIRRWCSQKLLPPQSVHLLLCHWCLHRPLPPQSLHMLLTRWCSATGASAGRYHRSLCTCSSRTEDRGLAGLLGCKRIWRRSCVQARCIGWVCTTLFVLAALFLWLSRHMLLQRVSRMPRPCGRGNRGTIQIEGTSNRGTAVERKNVAPELWLGRMHCLHLHHALRACGAFLVAPLRAPPAFSSCPPQQPPDHPCNPTTQVVYRTGQGHCRAS